MNQYPNAAGGLRLMFVAQILVIVGTLLIWVPLVGPVIVIVGGVVQLLGLYKAGTDDEGYRTALLITAVNLVVSLISQFLFSNGGVMSSLLGIVGDVLGLAAIYFVCTTTSNLLHAVGEEGLSERGGTVIKIYTVCTVVSVVCSVLSVVPVLNILAALVSIVAAIALLVGYIMYLLFLNSSSKAL